MSLYKSLYDSILSAIDDAEAIKDATTCDDTSDKLLDLIKELEKIKNSIY